MKLQGTIYKVSTDGIRLACSGKLQLSFPADIDETTGKPFTEEQRKGIGDFIFEIVDNDEARRTYHVGRSVQLTIELNPKEN
jgi:hypothetical protein